MTPGLGKVQNHLSKSLRIFANQVEIRRRYIPESERYHYANLPVAVSFIPLLSLGNRLCEPRAVLVAVQRQQQQRTFVTGLKLLPLARSLLTLLTEFSGFIVSVPGTIFSSTFCMSFHDIFSTVF
jgi:hypothetical protein